MTSMVIQFSHLDAHLVENQAPQGRLLRRGLRCQCVLVALGARGNCGWLRNPVLDH